MRAANKDQREAKREFILRMAEARFARHGFQGTGMAEICVATKMSPGNLYRYFDSKDDIIRAIVERDRAQLLALVEGVGRSQDLISALVHLAREIMKRASGAGYGRIAMEVQAEAGRNKVIGTVYRSADQDIRAALESALCAAAHAGRIDAGTDCKAAAIWLLALGDGVVARFAINPATDRHMLTPMLERMIRCALSASDSEHSTREPATASGKKENGASGNCRA